MGRVRRAQASLRVGRLVSTRLARWPLKALPSLPLVLTGLLLLVSLTVLSSPPHLSATVSLDSGGTLRVASVLPGGFAWDAGIRPGDQVVSYRLASSAPQDAASVRDPTALTVRRQSDGAVLVAVAEDLVLVRGVGLFLLWLEAFLFAGTAALIYSIRGWDPASRRLLGLFGSFSVTLAVGSFSGTKGGPLPLLLAGTAINLTAYSLVEFLAAFPVASLSPDWRRRRVIPLWRGLLVFILASLPVAILLLPQAYDSVTALVGLYLVGSLVIGVAELAWAYRTSASAVRRAQIQMLVAVCAIGLGPLFIVGLAPQLVLNRPLAVPVEPAAVLTLLVPVGVSYTIVRYQHRRVAAANHWLALGTVVVVVSFIASVFAFTYLSSGLDAGEVEAALAASVMGGITVVLVVSAGWLLRLARAQRLDHGHRADASERTVARRIAELLRNGPMRNLEMLRLELQNGKTSPERLATRLDALVAQMRLMVQAETVQQTEGALDDLVIGLEKAVHELESLSHVAITYAVSGRERSREAADSVNHALYVTGLEALLNALYHAEATEIHLALSFEFDSVRLTVADNGRGFDASSWWLRGDFAGLRQMRDRVAAVDGSLNIMAVPGQGTTVLAQVPMAGFSPGPNTFDDGLLALDRRSLSAWVRGMEVQLTRTEFHILWALAQNDGRAVARDDIARAAWGPLADIDSLSGPVKWHISRLRRKLAVAGVDESIVSAVRGVGYRYGPPLDGQNDLIEPIE